MAGVVDVARAKTLLHNRGNASLIPGLGRKAKDAAVAQSVERFLGKDEVLGSNPSSSSWTIS
jgi:hypothetical protein